MPFTDTPIYTTHKHSHTLMVYHQRTDRPTDTDRLRTHAQVVAKIEICAVTTCAKWGILCVMLCYVLYINFYVHNRMLYGRLVDTHFGFNEILSVLGMVREKNCGSMTRHTYRPESINRSED